MTSTTGQASVKSPAQAGSLHIESAIVCPRCGYDQRGVVETWKESCLLEGVCSECGLAYRWAEVFNPRLHRPKWCVEYGRLLAFPWRAIRTLGASFWPWRFWWRLQMHHEAKWLRICVYLSAIVSLLYVAFIAQVGVSAYLSWQSFDEQMMMVSNSWSSMTPEKRQQAIARGQVPDNWIVADGVPAWQAVGHAVLFPLSNEYSGTYVFADGTTRPYSRRPRDFTIGRFGNATDWLTTNERAIGITLMFPVVMGVIVPMLFSLLPHSRRISRVRSAHLIRITLYSVPFFVFALVLCFFRLPRYGGYSPWLGQRHWGEVALIMFVVMPAILFIWWGTAISRHLRMRSPWMIALALTAIAYLLPMVCGYFWLIVEQRPDWFMAK